MKLLTVIPSFYPAVVYGGPIFTSFHTAEELSKINIEVRVSTTNANMTSKLDVKTGIWEQFNEQFFVKYYNETIINKISLPLLFNIWKDIKNSDLVHLQGLFSTPTPITLIYAKIFKKTVILTPHGTLGEWCLKEGSKLKRLWLNLFIKPFNSTTIWHATAEMEKNEILKIFPEANIIVIANGIHINEFENSNKLSKKEYVKKFTNQGFEPNKIIVSMGRLQKKKGFDILIDSFNETLKSYPNSILLIAGADEGEEKNLKKQIKNLNLGNSVFLVGAISGQDKIDFLANANLFCLPSHNENFGIVYTESLASGTPIIASRNTPWSEIEEYNCGRWVENSIEQTSNAMNEVLSYDRETMKINSKNLAHKYDWKNIAIEFKNLYEKILKDKNHE
ncbi:glycosyltransferase [Arcobacter arenosus]|uniref:glycosyltransferase n=1 Tax=Arcobacter arenosus TaxID=2576037 RepID=UPI003BAA2AA4